MQVFNAWTTAGAVHEEERAGKRYISPPLSLSVFSPGFAPDRPPPGNILWKIWLMMFIQTTNENEIRPAERRESGGEAFTLYVFNPPPFLPLSLSTIHSSQLTPHRALQTSKSSKPSRVRLPSSAPPEASLPPSTNPKPTSIASIPN